MEKDIPELQGAVKNDWVNAEELWMRLSFDSDIRIKRFCDKVVKVAKEKNMKPHELCASFVRQYFPSAVAHFGDIVDGELGKLE